MARTLPYYRSPDIQAERLEQAADRAFQCAAKAAEHGHLRAARRWHRVGRACAHKLVRKYLAQSRAELGLEWPTLAGADQGQIQHHLVPTFSFHLTPPAGGEQ